MKKIPLSPAPHTIRISTLNTLKTIMICIFFIDFDHKSTIRSGTTYTKVIKKLQLICVIFSIRFKRIALK